MNLYDRQIELERESINRGLQKLREQLEADVASGRAAENPVGQAQISRLVDRMVDGVKELQLHAKRCVRRGVTTGQRLSGWEIPVAMMDVDVMAYITVHTLFNRATSGSDEVETTTANRLGEVCNLQLRYNQLRAGEKDRRAQPDADPKYNRVEMMKREVRSVNPRSVKKWLRKMSDIETDIWPLRTRAAVGFQLMQVAFEQCPDIFERVEHKQSTLKGIKTTVTIQLTPHARETIQKRLKGMGLNMPWLMPMIHKPRQWGPEQLGGYLTIHREFIKNKVGHVPNEYPVPDAVYKAVNTIQETPWRINSRVFEIAKKAVERGETDILPVAPRMELPEMVPASEWEVMPQKERSKVRLQRRLVYDTNYRLESRRAVMERQLEIADRFEDTVIYFPHNLDFRGRVYPMGSELHPQADDFGKSLLCFAEGKPLGERGITWLMYQVASAYGLDKMDRIDQINWVLDNSEKLKDLVNDPFMSVGFWKEADEPWQFLAAVQEFIAAWVSDDPEGYVSHLPVKVDGSCNGLQHLSAMGRDEVGAKAVNLTPGPRKDIYQLVADRVEELTPPESNWKGNITRKVVKRGVMTTPYGLTPVGMRDQLLSDRHKCWPDLPGDTQENANEMKVLMSKAISDVVVASIKIMDWMQECAGILADAGKGMWWTTPIDMRVVHHYRPMTVRTYTLVGVGFKSQKHKRSLAEATDGVAKSKQITAVAPNIVHSFDAAHLMLSVNAQAERGHDSFLAVHDSFGCHAADMDDFLYTIKDQFVKMYKSSVLNSLYEEFRAQAPEGVVIPEPPEMGTFNIEQVRRSDWFFA